MIHRVPSRTSRRRAGAAMLTAVSLGLAACGGAGGAATAVSPTPSVVVTTSGPVATASAVPSSPGAVTPAGTGPSASTGSPPARTATAKPTTTRPPTGTTAPADALPARLAGKDWERIPTDRKVVALTFDAGANADGVAPILATLAKERVPGTFFLTGQFVTGYPAQVRAIAAAGGRLGNHSVSHPYFTKLDDAAVRGEVQGAEREIRAATGSDPKPLFRFPFGDRNAHAIALVNSLGYVPIRWTVDTLGWQGTSGGRSPASVTARVLAAAAPGEIVLMHLGSHPTDHSTLDADALPGIIAALRERGYGFVTLDTLLG